MKSLYIECNMGAAGDMLLAALTELMPDREGFVKKLNGIGIPGVVYTMHDTVKCGIRGTGIDVSVNGETEGGHGHRHEHHHHHSGMHDIMHIIERLNVSDNVKKNVSEVYELIAEAESIAHGRPVAEIHFHEVGTMDAVADITGVCLAIEELAPDKIFASPVHVGCGTVHCAHGILPVPAPATAHILKDIPIYGGAVKGELCTPTGAALLKHFVSEFGEMPVMRVNSIGYGMGHKDFETANCVRALMGEINGGRDSVSELKCNIDDMTGEEIGYATRILMEEGALDVYTAPIGMKKNRPGVLLTCMCREEDRERMLGLMFRHTSTIGIREYICSRYAMERTVRTVDTDCGEVRIKRSEGWGTAKEKAEYADIERIAAENDASIAEIKARLTGK